MGGPVKGLDRRDAPEVNSAHSSYTMSTDMTVIVV
jgi:hypothetical protein